MNINIEKFIINSACDNTSLSCMIYKPDIEAKGIFQIVHGMCEYKERYIDFINFMAENGYIVAIHDHRGHGHSVKNENELGYFNDKTARFIVEDTIQFTRFLKDKYKNLPLILFGHSMGSMVVRCAIQKYDDEISKLIVCGSPSKNLLVDIAIMLTNIIGAAKGDYYRSPLLSKLSTGKGDDKFPLETGKNVWLTRDESIVKKYNSDKYCNFTFTVNGFQNLFKLLKNTYKKNRYLIKNENLPILFISGSDDPVMNNTSSWINSQKFLRKVGYHNIYNKLYNSMRHEILNEIGKEEVYSDILEYVNKP